MFKTRDWLIIIFSATLLLRLILAFSMPTFTYDSYFHLRQVEHITETGLPLYHDPLSYGGRSYVFLPLFHYLAAFVDVFLPLELLAKILPNLLMASLTLIVYGIAHRITPSETPALLSSLIAGILPILYTPSYFGPQALFLPLIFLSTYFFLQLTTKTNLYLFLITFILSSFTSAASFLMLIGFLIYLLLSRVEHKKIGRGEVEVIVFSLFVYVWIQFMFYKDLLLSEGIGFVWQNVPSSIIAQYFPKIALTTAMLLVGIIPFFTGIVVVYQSLFTLRNMRLLLLMSLVISTTILTWLRLLPFTLSLSFFGIVLAILFSSGYASASQYLSKTKITWLPQRITILTVALLVVSTLPLSFYYAFDQHVPTAEEVAAFASLSRNTPASAGIISLLEEGSLVSYAAGRRNFMDEIFVGVSDVDKRFSDLNAVYTTPFQTEALRILNEYKYNYLVLTPKARNTYGIKNFGYLNADCFERVYKNETRIYISRCVLQEVK